MFSLLISDADIFLLFCLLSYFAFSQTFSNYSWKTLQCTFFFRPRK